MNRSDVKELHFITYIDNVPSIMNHGILSHNRSRKLKYRDISEEGVQERRATKKIPGTNRKLHDYANLYFDSHNPMLSARRSKNDQICVLRVQSTVLDIKDVIVTDRNGARECWFKTVNDGLPLLDRDEIYATFWINNDDPIKEHRHAGIKCAEVLVPNHIHPDYIFGAYVANNTALDKLKGISNIRVTINSNLFFLRGGNNSWKF